MATTQVEQLIAREYRRLSNAKGGSSIARQGSDNARGAAEQNWALGKPYIDDGKSASKYATKQRDDFQQLVADLSTGPTGRTSTFGADVLMLWESSRGSRQVGEWVSFIELCEAKGVKIWVTTHQRLYNPANGRDRKALLQDAVDSEFESYQTHERVSGTKAFDASEGRPHGKAPDGMMAVYDPKTGKLVTWVEDPKRCDIPKTLFKLLEEGVSLKAIEQRYREAGIVNLSGTPFFREHLRVMATRHSYAGLRYHKGTVYEGMWDGIVPEEQFWTVQAILSDPSRKSTRDGRADHELTEIVRCGVCGGPMRYGRSTHEIYLCRRNGCVRVDAEEVWDDFVGTREAPGVILTYLAREDIHEILAKPGSSDEDVRDLRAVLARERAELNEMKEARAGTLAEARVLARSIEAKESTVRELAARERELTIPSAVLRFIRPGGDVWEAWEEAPVSARREMIRVVLGPSCLGTVFFHRTAKLGRYQAPVRTRTEMRRERPVASVEAVDHVASV